MNSCNDLYAECGLLYPDFREAAYVTEQMLRHGLLKEWREQGMSLEDVLEVLQAATRLESVDPGGPVPEEDRITLVRRASGQMAGDGYRAYLAARLDDVET